jgi:cell division protein FtsB
MYKQALTTKVAVFGLLALLLFLGDLKYKQWQSQKEIEKQKQNLLAQADQLQKKNDELNQSLEYLNSESFKERVARQQLNLKKQGETTYSFGDAPAPGGSNSSQPRVKNAQKWWNYFFATE